MSNAPDWSTQKAGTGQKGAEPQAYGFNIMRLQSSDITHPYCFIADNSADQSSGLDYSKAAVIIDSAKYIDPEPVTIFDGI